MTVKKATVMAVLLGLVTAAVYGFPYAGRMMSVASAYYAKTLCSGVFVGGRPPPGVIEQDVLGDMSLGLRRWSGKIDRARNLVTVSLYGFEERSALYRPGIGCTLVTDISVDELLRQVREYTPPRASERSMKLWPEGERAEISILVDGVDTQKLKIVMDEAFSEPNQDTRRRTRALIVVHKGRIIAERSAPNIGLNMPLPGWSMGKSVLNALIGTLVADGLLNLNSNRLFASWRSEGDPRGAITVDDLLRMVSGLDFDAPHEHMLSDVNDMLFMKGDGAAYAASEQMAAPVGGAWNYSSGSTMLLSSVMHTAIGGSQAQQFSYPRKALFAPLGMNSAVLEPDAAGTFVAPAFIYASARDWARLGQLYLQDGVWNGKRILPEGWVKTSLKPAPHSRGQYGAHLWLKIPDFLRPTNPLDTPLPEDAFFMLGYDGQMVAIIPSRELVVVRLGLSRSREVWDHEAFLHELLKAFGGAR